MKKQYWIFPTDPFIFSEIELKAITAVELLVLVVLDKENIPMGSYLLDLSDEAWQSGTSNGRARYGSMHNWMMTGVLVIGGMITTIPILLRKKKR